MGSFIMKGNYKECQNNSGILKPIKKYQTSDFEDHVGSPSPFLANYPSLILGHNSV